jgi:hypothetical protein
MEMRKTAVSYKRSSCEESRSPRGRPECERNDEAHLLWATADHRTLYSFNVRDYYRLHTEFLANGKSHAGIVLAKQQRYSVGEQMRRLLKLIETKSGEEMVNQIEFLSDWE